MILFSDFDNTFFFRDDEEKTRRNIEAVKAWRADGNQFCITTGRSYRSVVEQLPEITSLSDYFIVDSGSIILASGAELIEAFYFEPSVVERIINFSKQLPEAPVAYYYVPFSEDENYKTERVTKLRLWFKDVSLLESVKTQIQSNFPVCAFDLAFPANITPPQPALAGTHGFIEIIPAGFGKSHAIKVLQSAENLQSSDIITVGDGFNDYEMIRDFNGYAIEGSVLAGSFPELKTAESVWALLANNQYINSERKN